MSYIAYDEISAMPEPTWNICDFCGCVYTEYNSRYHCRSCSDARIRVMLQGMVGRMASAFGVASGMLIADHHNVIIVPSKPLAHFASEKFYVPALQLGKTMQEFSGAMQGTTDIIRRLSEAYPAPTPKPARPYRPTRGKWWLRG